ncbi:hypothetical protein [Thiothrix unzii]|nr:hypothetical protein [Thiothrix unzii]
MSNVRIDGRSGKLIDRSDELSPRPSSNVLLAHYQPMSSGTTVE